MLIGNKGATLLRHTDDSAKQCGSSFFGHVTIARVKAAFEAQDKYDIAMAAKWLKTLVYTPLYCSLYQRYFTLAWVEWDILERNSLVISIMQTNNDKPIVLYVYLSNIVIMGFRNIATKTL